MSSGIAPVFKGLVSHPWAYPALEAVHIVGIAMLFGGLLVFELRALGLGRDLREVRGQHLRGRGVRKRRRTHR